MLFYFFTHFSKASSVWFTIKEQKWEYLQLFRWVSGSVLYCRACVAGSNLGDAKFFYFLKFYFSTHVLEIRVRVRVRLRIAVSGNFHGE